MVLQSLPDTSNVANFKFLWNPLSELRGVKVFRNVKSMRFLGRYFAPGANIVPPIAYKSHSTPLPIRPHVLTPHSWLCDKNCGRSSAPKKSGRRIISFDNNTNVALPYMASTIKYVFYTSKINIYKCTSKIHEFQKTKITVIDAIYLKNIPMKRQKLRLKQNCKNWGLLSFSFPINVDTISLCRVAQIVSIRKANFQSSVSFLVLPWKLKWGEVICVCEAVTGLRDKRDSERKRPTRLLTTEEWSVTARPGSLRTGGDLRH